MAIQFRLENTFTIKHCGESTTGMNEFYCRFEKPPFTTSCIPHLPHTGTADKRRRRAPGLQKEQDKEGTRPKRWHQSVWNPVLTSWPPSSHLQNPSSTDHWSCVKSPHVSNAPPSSPSQRNPKLLDLMTHHHEEHCDWSGVIQIPGWAPQFLRNWSGTITLSPLWKRPSRSCTSFASWGSSSCHRSCWNSSTLPSLNPSSARQ